MQFLVMIHFKPHNNNSSGGSSSHLCMDVCSVDISIGCPPPSHSVPVLPLHSKKCLAQQPLSTGKTMNYAETMLLLANYRTQSYGGEINDRLLLALV